MGLWKVITPESTTNIVKNPSAETTANFAAGGAGATVTRVKTWSRRGIWAYSLSVTTTQTDYLSLTTTALSAADYFVSFYTNIQVPLPGGAQVSLDGGANWVNVGAISNSSDATNNRYGVVVPTAKVTAGGTALRITLTNGATVIIDAVQVELKGYATTYTDGDLAGGKWAGARHGSASSRDSRYAGGGRLLDLADDYGVQVLINSGGVGMPQVVNSILQTSLQPGALFQNSRTQPRFIDLIFNVSGSSWTNFHAARQNLIDLIKPDRILNQQPLTICYTGAGRYLYCNFRYDSGLEFNNVKGFNETVRLRLMAVDPFWYEDAQDITAIDTNDTLTYSRGLQRVNGAWSACDTTGFDDYILDIKVDNARNRVYWAGNFTTPSSRIVYWDGSAMNALSASVINGAVYALLIDPAGNVYAGGAFTTIGGSNAKFGIWSVSAGTWTLKNPTVTAFTTVLAFAANSIYTKIYIGGNFTGWDALGINKDYLVQYNVAAGTYSAVYTPTGAVNCLAVDQSDNLYVGGAGYFDVWNGTTATTYAVTGGSAVVNKIIIDENGNAIATGNFTSIGGVSATNIAVFNGTRFQPLGNGINNTGTSLALYAGELWAAGLFDSAGDNVITRFLARYANGVWYSSEITLQTAPAGNIYAMAFNPYGDLFAGNYGGTSATVQGTTTVTNNGSAGTFPYLIITGPTTANSQAYLFTVYNFTTNENLYFDLTISTGETAVIDLRRGQKRVISETAARSAYGGQGAAGFWGALSLPILGGRVVPDQPLPNSDFTSFHLQPGANTIRVGMSGELTGVEMYFVADRIHWSIDGPQA